MYCPEKLKLNKHQVVSIPKGREVFGRIGSVSAPQNLYTGDEVAPDELNKVDSMAATEEALYEQYASEEESKGKK